MVVVVVVVVFCRFIVFVITIFACFWTVFSPLVCLICFISLFINYHYSAIYPYTIYMVRSIFSINRPINNQPHAPQSTTGKHTGNLLGYPPTRKVVAWMGATEFTCQNGRILKVWELGDIKTLEEQLTNIVEMDEV